MARRLGRRAAITAADIEQHRTFVASIDGEVVGVCQLQEGERGAMLEHVWVDPRYHGQGVGRALVRARAVGGPGADRRGRRPECRAFLREARRAAASATVRAPMPGAPARTLPLLEFERRS